MKKQIENLSLGDVSPSPPNLYLVKGGGKFGSNVGVQSNEISGHVGSPLPKEHTLSFSEITESEISPAHLQAIEDVVQFDLKQIKAMELRKRHLKTYKNWEGMTCRCKADLETGIRSIALDPSFEKFADFLRIAGPRPDPTWSIDRIDPTGPYSPDNCRWASKKTQSRNRTNTVNLTYRDVTLTLVEWAEKVGVPADRLRSRKRAGWSDEEIIEGAKKSGYAGYTSQPSLNSRTPFDYTPWPLNYREQLESAYQRGGRGGEHRLAFMKRYSSERMGAISDSAEGAAWPEYHTPTPKEEEFSKQLTLAHDFWLGIFRDAQQKIAGDYTCQLYGRVSLPSWVKERLSSYR